LMENNLALSEQKVFVIFTKYVKGY